MTDPTYQRGTLDEAVANGKRLLSVNPAAAAAQAHAILRRDRDNADAFRLLGRALRMLGRSEDAGHAELQAIRVSARNPILANVARAMKAARFLEAEKALRSYLRAHPDDAAATMMMGQVAVAADAYPEAEGFFREALALAPAYREARFALATLLLDRNRLPDALSELAWILTSNAQDLDALRLKAAILERMGKHAEAIDEYEGLLAIHPSVAPAWTGYGDALRAVGRRGESASAYRRAIDLDPQSGSAWWSLASLAAADLGEADVAAMEAALRSGRQGSDSFCLHFALGRAHEEAKRFDRAFHHYAEANRLRAATRDYDPETLSAEIGRTKRLFTSAFLAGRAGQGCASPGPIFILGMPRSGSTLLEQILAGHSRVEALSELPHIPYLIQELCDAWEPEGKAYPELLESVTGAQLRSLGEEYLRRVAAERRTKTDFFIDKLPYNWMNVGFIHLILPNAIIIDIRRAPLDCCLSNFRHYFPIGHPSSNALDTLGLFFRDYVDLLDHFDQVLPGRIYRIFYENLVEAPEREIGRLLRHLGLPLEDGLLRHHERVGGVRTASSEQVRRPINRDGLGSSAPFDAWLAPLKRALGGLTASYEEDRRRGAA